MFGTVGSRAGKSAAALLRGKAATKVALNDASSRVGNASKFWNPTYFGNPGQGEVHRLNRLLVGEATLGSSDNPMTVPDWLETAAGGTTSGGQTVSVSSIGGLGLVGASRSSDYRTWAGGATGGAEGVLGIGWNDDATAATTPIAVGGDFRGWRKTGVVGITGGTQMSAANNGSTIDVTPHSGIVSGATFASLLTAGPGPTGYTNPVSAGAILGPDGLGSIFRKGIVWLNGALDTSLGAGGGGIAAELYTGQSLRWLNSSDAVVSEVWGSTAGLTIASQLNVKGSADFFNALVAEEDHTGANQGPYFIAYRHNTSPASADNLGCFLFQGDNSAGTKTNVGGLATFWQSVTPGSEAAAFVIQTIQVGAYGNRVTIGAGVLIGSPAGGDKGAGTINASAYYAIAGTASLAPLNLTAGANLTAAAAGAIEFDGKTYYGTAVANSRQAIVAEQISILTTDFTGTNVATAQPVFSTAQDTLTVAASTTYEFEFEYEIDTTGATSHSLALLFGGTATFTSISYSTLATNSTAAGTASAPLLSRAAAATAQTVTAAVATATQNTVRGRGTARVNGAGTVIPQFQYSAAPGAAPTVKANSFFRLWAVGSDAVAAVGAWA